LLLKQEGDPMVEVDLITREGDGRVAVALTGELDVEAARVVAALHASGARQPALAKAGLPCRCCNGG
jgi:hypothetical protein